LLLLQRSHHITDWDNTTSSGTPSTNLTPGYDANGNLTSLPAMSVTGGGPSQFDLIAVTFTYDRKNRLKTYLYSGSATRTLYWDALGRIREKTWTEDSTDFHQVFYHDGRQLVQIWDQTVNEDLVTRTLAYDLYRGTTGYLKDIDFNSDPDEEGYLIKDAQGTVRAIVNVSYSGGTYSVSTERYNLDGYGAWLNFDSAHSNGAHYMRYISCRVEDYGNPGSSEDNQALIHTDHRHYLPWLGIFLQREPLITSAKGDYIISPLNILSFISCYRYALNKPTIASDRTGMDCSEYSADAFIQCLDAWIKDSLECDYEYYENKDKHEICGNHMSIFHDRQLRKKRKKYNCFWSDYRECLKEKDPWECLKRKVDQYWTVDKYLNIAQAYECNGIRIENLRKNCRSCALEKLCDCYVKNLPRCFHYEERPLTESQIKEYCPLGNGGMGMFVCTLLPCAGCEPRFHAQCKDKYLYVDDYCINVDDCKYGLPGSCSSVGVLECMQKKPALFGMQSFYNSCG
jgi:RHS repeat-associated protein